MYILNISRFLYPLQYNKIQYYYIPETHHQDTPTALFAALHLLSGTL